MNRDNRGRFASNKWFVVKFIGLPVVIVVLGLIVAYQYNHPKIVTNTVTIDNSDVNFASKIDSLEKSVVEQVRACESGGKKESDGLITFDTNHVASIGTLQMQVHTIVYYEKSLYNKVITNKEAILIALDNEQSGALAQQIMFSSKNLANDWLNCSNKLSLEAQIVAIKKIK